MKIVILTGSPHHPGTSEQLADAFEETVVQNGNEVYRFDAGRRVNEFSLLQLEDDHAGMEVALHPDDVVENEVLPKLIDADLVVLVTSLYYYGVNAALKAIIDRFYAYNHELYGGKQVDTLVSGYGDDDAFASLNLYFQQLLDYMRWQPAGSVLASGAWNDEKLQQHVKEASILGQQFK